MIAAKKEAASANNLIAVIRIKSTPMISVKVDDALNFIRLHKKFYCSVLNPSPQVMGTLHKIKSFVAWGEIDSETLKLLKDKREEKGRPFFRMHPPRGGFERKGIKVPFSRGGAYGYRGKEINELIRRMI